MDRLILAHVPGDESAAEVISAGLTEYWTSLVQVTDGVRPVSLGSGVILGLVWSANAASGAQALVDFAASAAGSTLIFNADGAPLAPVLTQLGASEVRAETTARELLALMRSARAGRRGRAMSAPASMPAAQATAPAGYNHVFLGGVTRGFASGVAMLGLGAGVAIGIQEKAGTFGVAPSFANGVDPTVKVATAGLTDDAEELAEPQLTYSVGLLSERDLAREASALRVIAAQQRELIATRLDLAEHDLADARVRTDNAITRLQTISVGVGVPMMASAPQPHQPQMAAAPSPQPVQVTFGAPVETPAPLAPMEAQSAQGQIASADMYALTRYADRASAPAEPAAQPAKLGLWSPT